MLCAFVRPAVPRIAQCLALAALCLLAGGCTTVRDYLAERLPPGEPAAVVAAEQQAALDRLYADGGAALARQDLAAAAAAWRRYGAIAPPGHALAHKLRGYATLLERESARRFAREAAARERDLPTDARPPNPLHVAVFPFRAEGPAAATAPFNRALLAMIATDLARVPGLTVLERERVEALMAEMKLAASGLVDPVGAAAPARLLGAGTVVSGSVLNEPSPAGPGTGRYRIHAAALDMRAGRVIATPEAGGKQAEFFELQKQVVYGILEALPVREIPAAVRRVHTRSWEAYSRFSAGLNLLAQDRFSEARRAFQAALEADPGFELAEQAFLATPERAASIEQIRAETVPAR